MARHGNPEYCRYRIVNVDTLLHRVIARWMVQEGQVSSQAFRPRPTDEKQLSAYNGNLISAEDAYSHYVNDPAKPAPVGVLAVSVHDCTSLDLLVCPDPETFPEHVLVDFRKYGTNQIKRKSSGLCSVAIARGWQFRP